MSDNTKFQNAEEAAAWVQFTSTSPYSDARRDAAYADELLDEYRKRRSAK